MDKTEELQQEIDQQEAVGKPYLLGITNFNGSTNIFISKDDGEVYSHQEKISQNKNVSWRKIYTIYAPQIGKGNYPIYIKSSCKLDEGDNKVYLNLMNEDELKNILSEMKNYGLQLLCKKAGIQLALGDERRSSRPKTKDDLIGEFLMHQKDNFFEPTFPIDKDEIKKIGNPLLAILGIMRNGLEKDPRIDYVFAANIPEADPRVIDPHHYQKFNGHMMIFTNPKVGKSTDATLIAGEVPFERPTEAGLLGYADSRDKHYGKLHERCKPTALDEVGEEKDEELFGKVHSYMETGETQIARGCSVNLRGYSPILFMGNPKSKGNQADQDFEKYEMVQKFKGALTKITRNVKPFGSRIALTVFGLDFQQVKGKADNEVLGRGQAIIRTIAEAFKAEFTILFFDEDVLQYLSTNYHQEYTEAIKGIAEKCSDDLVKQFIQGQLEAYRHTRGLALKLAWLDIGLPSLWNSGKADIPLLLENAQQHFMKLEQINLESYQNILSLMESEPVKGMQRLMLKSIKPEYLKLGLYTLFEWSLANPEVEDRIIPLSLTESSFAMVNNKCHVDGGSKYQYFSRIREAFKQNGSLVGSRLQDYDLNYDISLESFVILDVKKLKDTIKDYVSIYPSTKGTEGTLNKDDGMKREGTESTEGTVNKDDGMKREGTESTEGTVKSPKQPEIVPFVPCTKPFLQQNAILQYVKSLGSGTKITEKQLIEQFGKPEEVFQAIAKLLSDGDLLYGESGTYIVA